MAQYSITESSSKQYSIISVTNGGMPMQYWSIPKTAKIDVRQGKLFIFLGEKQLMPEIDRISIISPQTETDAELFSMLAFMTDAVSASGFIFENGTYQSGGRVRLGGNLTEDTTIGGGAGVDKYALVLSNLRAFSASTVEDTTFRAGGAIRLLSDTIQLNSTSFVYWGNESTDGSFRQGVEGGQVVIQQKILGVWTTINSNTVGFGLNVVVGISTSGDTESDCDFLDTGNGGALQTAISSISASGGIVLVRSGDITLNDFLTISGTGVRVMGSGTILRTKAEGLRKAVAISGQHNSFEGFRIIISELATSASGTEVVSIAGNYTRFERNYLSYKKATSDTITALIRVATNTAQVSIEDNTLESLTMLYTQKGIDIMSLCQNIKCNNTFSITGVAYYVDNATNCNLIGIGVSDRAAHLSSCTRVSVSFVGSANTSNAALSAPYNYGIYLSSCTQCLINDTVLYNSTNIGTGFGLVNSTEITISDATLSNFLLPLTGDVTSYAKLVACVNQAGVRYEYLTQNIHFFDSELEVMEMKFAVTVNTTTPVVVFTLPCQLDNQYKIEFLLNYKRSGLSNFGWFNIQSGVCRDVSGTVLSNNSPLTAQQDGISGANPSVSQLISGNNYQLTIDNNSTTNTRFSGVLKIIKTNIPATF